MFNDDLSAVQSQGLMSQLAESDFPFVCAHGRYVRLCSFSFPSTDMP